MKLLTSSSRVYYCFMGALRECDEKPKLIQDFIDVSLQTWPSFFRRFLFFLNLLLRFFKTESSILHDVWYLWRYVARRPYRT